MSEPKSELEKIRELDAKLHELKMKKLLHIESLNAKNEEIAQQLTQLDEDLKNAYKQLMAGPVDKDELFRWQTIIKCIDSRKSILAGYKSVVHESRLALRLLMMEENQLTLRKIKAEAGA